MLGVVLFSLVLLHGSALIFDDLWASPHMGADSRPQDMGSQEAHGASAGYQEAPCGDRTHDRTLTKRMLYQLS